MEFTIPFYLKNGEMSIPKLKNNSNVQVNDKRKYFSTAKRRNIAFAIAKTSPPESAISFAARQISLTKKTRTNCP